MTSCPGGPPVEPDLATAAQHGAPLGRYRMDAVDLFLFSAACALPHRIHYDEEFARGEGFDGLPVHGPLQAALVAQAFDRAGRRAGLRVTGLRIRHLSPAYVGQELTLLPRAGDLAIDTAPARIAPGAEETAQEMAFSLVTGPDLTVAAGTVTLVTAPPRS